VRSAHIVDAVVVIQQGMRPSSVIVGVPAFELLVHRYAPWPSKPAAVLGQPLLALREVRHDAL
jgi:hypothetical protein